MAVAHRASAASGSTNPTTSCTITIPASVATGDVCFVAVTSRDHTAGTAYPTVTDDDGAGNTWTRITTAESADRKATLWYKIATSATASKTITVAGAVGSVSAGVSCYSGAGSTPYLNITVETNASGNETHAGFTPSHANSFVAFVVYNYGNDNAVTGVTCTAPGTLTNRYEKLSTGGSDCGNNFSAAQQSGGPTATGSITWSQTNGTTYSIAFEIPPVTVALASVFRGLARAAGLAFALGLTSAPVRALPMHALGAALTTSAGLHATGRATSARLLGSPPTSVLALHSTLRSGWMRGTGAVELGINLALGPSTLRSVSRITGAALSSHLALTGTLRSSSRGKGLLTVPSVPLALTGKLRATPARLTGQTFATMYRAAPMRSVTRIRGAPVTLLQQQVFLTSTLRSITRSPSADIWLVFDLAEMRMLPGLGTGLLSFPLPLQSTLRALPGRALSTLGITGPDALVLQSTGMATAARLSGAPFTSTLALRSTGRATPARLKGASFTSTLPLTSTFRTLRRTLGATLTLHAPGTVVLFSTLRGQALRGTGALTTRVPLVSTGRATPARFTGVLGATAPGILALQGTLRASSRIIGTSPTSQLALHSTGRILSGRLIQVVYVPPPGIARATLTLSVVYRGTIEAAICTSRTFAVTLDPHGG